MSEDSHELHTGYVRRPPKAAARRAGSAAWLRLAVRSMANAFSAELGLLIIAVHVLGFSRVASLPVLFVSSVVIAIIGATVVVLSRQSGLR